MKRKIVISGNDPLITLAEGIVYAQRPDWCNSTSRELRISLLRPRQYFDYDKKVIWPAIVWICGGAWTEMNRNVWIPELTWFAKKGYVVASVDYSVTARTRFPQQIVDIKEAIRFLRVHSDALSIDPNRIAVMGESAGGYLSALVGLTGNTRDYDLGTNLDRSSKVQVAIPWYPAVDISTFPMTDFLSDMLPPDFRKYPDVSKLVTKNAPPFMILHGTADTQVPISQSENLYDTLQKAGVESEIIILDNSEHAEASFIQTEIKELILEFLKKYL
jgi:acetyl esterase/lipase